MKVALTLVFLTLLTPAGPPSGKSVLGEWKTPNGSVVDIYKCGNNVCARLIEVSKQAPSHVDVQNPNPALRKRPLCGLEIGYGFHLTNENHAQDGRLYDPESGNTYSGWMTADGNTLQLRGYIGISLFGRTETWTRAQGDVSSCRG
jgi:uncharacterized protein (DUF2147 family)